MYYDMNRDELTEEYDRLYDEKNSKEIEIYEMESSLSDLKQELEDIKSEWLEVGEAMDRFDSF